MQGSAAVITHLFTDLEGISRLWEREPDRMQRALAQHDALGREAVEQSRGRFVKTTGDGIHAVFADPADAIRAALRFQRSLAALAADAGLPLRARCGMHAGDAQVRDDDYFGRAVNRAARIMAAAHGGQVLVSQAVAALVADRMPERASLRELGRVRLRDLAAPETVFQLVHAELPATFPPLRSLDATPNNLPQQLTSFVGRHGALTELRELLADHRLVTLTGPGGIGKTRLALQLAAQTLDDHPDGAWFVDLSATADPAMVASLVAHALSVTEEASRPLADTLAEFLASRHAAVAARQLRARDRRRRRAGRPAAAPRTRRADRRDEPRGAADRRRARLSARRARAARRRRRPRRGTARACVAAFPPPGAIAV